MKILVFSFIFFGMSAIYGYGAVKQVCINDACVRAEVADSAELREQGLMFRKALALDQGMLFIFEDEAPQAFWMKNMNFPLDIIWISSDKKVADIYENAQACQEECKTLIPRYAAKFVLEVNAGFTRENKIKIGQEASF